METKRCPYCGEEILAVAKKCKFCKEWIEEEPVTKQIECPVCAELIDADAVVCPYCNEPINQDSTNLAEQSRPETPVQIPTNAPAVSDPVQTVATVSPCPSVSEADNKDAALHEGFFKSYFWNVIIHHYADFKGSMSRKAFWMFMLFYGIYGVMFSFLLIVSACLGSTLGIIVGVIVYLFLLAVYIPCLAAYVRRLHDIGKSGWMILVALIPLIGSIWLLVLLCKKGESKSTCAKWQLSDTIQAGIMAIILALGIILSTVSGEKYYVFEDSQWIPNSDSSEFYAYAADDKRDVADRANGYLSNYGARYIVAADEPFGKVRKIISSEDIKRKNRLASNEMYFKIIPSTISPHLIYFNYAFGEDADFCGKVDSRTGAFDLFNGAIIGMISKGSLKGNYVRVDDHIPGASNGVKIFPQSAVGQSAMPISTFNIKRYWPDHDNYDLIMDDEFAEQVINWLENQ